MAAQPSFVHGMATGLWRPMHLAVIGRCPSEVHRVLLQRGYTRHHSPASVSCRDMEKFTYTLKGLCNPTNCLPAARHIWHVAQPLLGANDQVHVDLAK